MNDKFENRVGNVYEFTSDTCIGYTNKNEIFITDIDKYDLICPYVWHISRDGLVIAAVPKHLKGFHTNATQIQLHRLVMQCPDNLVVDHIRGTQSRFDNRTCNLRVCTTQQNQYNKQCTGKLPYKGVTLCEGKFLVRIQQNRQSVYLGYYQSIIEAANAYDRAAQYYFGEYAVLNNIQGPLPYKPPKVRVLKYNMINNKYGKTVQRCTLCGVPCSGKYCLKCFRQVENKQFQHNHPELTRNSLKQLIRTTSFLQIGKLYGVSDNAIRKWCKKYNLPTKSNEIKRYSDDEWKIL